MRALFVALLLTLPFAANASDLQRHAGLMMIDSAYSPAETAERFKAAITAKGIKVIADVDHAGAAAKANLSLPPTLLVIFGNPKIGTPLMEMAPTIAVDLPLRAIFWEEDGAAHAAVLDPRVLARRHGIDPNHPRIEGMEKALTMFLKSAAEGS